MRVCVHTYVRMRLHSLVGACVLACVRVCTWCVCKTVYVCVRVCTWHVCVCVCVCVSVVVRVDAKLVERSVDDVVEFEARIVSQSRDLLSAGSRGQTQRRLADFNEILSPLGSETQLVALSRDNGLALFFTCMTLSAVESLRDHWRTWQLRDIVEKLFTFLTGYTRQVLVNRLTWPVTDYERCLDFFRSLRGKQTISSWIITIITRSS